MLKTLINYNTMIMNNPIGNFIEYLIIILLAILSGILINSYFVFFISSKISLGFWLFFFLTLLVLCIYFGYTTLKYTGNPFRQEPYLYLSVYSICIGCSISFLLNLILLPYPTTLWIVFIILFILSGILQSKFIKIKTKENSKEILYTLNLDFDNTNGIIFLERFNKKLFSHEVSKMNFIIASDQVKNLPVKVGWLKDILSKEAHFLLSIGAFILFSLIFTGRVDLNYIQSNILIIVLIPFVFLVYMIITIKIIFYCLKIIENQCYKYFLSNQININYTIHERFVYSNVYVLLDLMNYIIEISTSDKDNKRNIELAKTLYEIIKDVLSLKSA